MREATIAASLLIDFLGYLERRGLHRGTVSDAASLDPRWVGEPDARVPASAMERLWTAAEALTGDADLGLHSAESYNPGALGIAGYVILSSRTTGEALERLARYAPLLNEGLRVELVHEKGAVVCRFGASGRFDSFLHRTPRQAVETLAAGIVLTLKRLAPQQPEPVAVSFRHAAPASTAEHRRILGPHLCFDAGANAVVYTEPAMAAPLLSADPALLQLFEVDARRRMAALATQGTVSGRLQAILAARMKGEVPGLAALAAELAMSERSIQRSLRDEGTTYRELVDRVRKELALAHLERPGATATDVAFMLGFSEPSAFTRAFKRWTGSAPSQFKSG